MSVKTPDPATLERLRLAAREAQSRAYCKYSDFSVGAAILTDKGEIVSGCNVENASYGLTICAERVAIGRCVVQDSGKPVAVVVVGKTRDPLTPCGACRQVLIEFNPAMAVICFGTEGEPEVYSAQDLLPGSFDCSALDK